MNTIEPSRLLAQLALYCAKTLERDKGGRAFADKLGLQDERLFERFRVGFATNALLSVIPSKGPMRAALTDLGLLTKQGKVAIEGCLVVPVPDLSGEIRGIVIIDPGGKEKRIPANLPLHALNPQPLRNRPAVFVDSVLKALLYAQAGIVEVLPLSEESIVAEEAFIRENRPQKAFCDMDKPGGFKMLQRLEIPCHRLKITWPATTDQINEAIKKAEPFAAHVGQDATAKVLDELVRFTCEEREYELTDLDPRDTERLRVRLRAVRNGAFHLDTLDLYAARSRANFAKAAANLFGVAAGDLEGDLCLMIRKMEAIRAADRRKRAGKNAGYSMTADEEAEALEYLGRPGLLGRVIQDMEKLGYLGEEVNKKIGYLITISRKLESPLCGVILSRAGSGKSSLMELLAEMIPAEDLTYFTRMTPQALYYSAHKGLRNKVLMSGEDEGLAGSDYALRELISSKKIRLAAPVRESETGKFQIEEYEVEGPIALLFSTTKPSIHFENATRCFMLSLDESSEQTRVIHEAQRHGRTAIGLENRAVKEELRRLHRNVQRMLRKVVVLNPFAPHLDFPSEPLQMRREHEKYLSLIDAVTLLHQHQRRRFTAEINGREVECVEAAIEDIEEANRLMTEILGTGRDELARPSRELLGHVRRMVEERAKTSGVSPAAVRFNRRDIREFTGWSDSQIKAHISQLENLEYLLVSKGERGRTYRYELSYEDAVLERKRLPGLTDTAKLRALARKGGLWDAAAMVRKSGMVGYGLVEVRDHDSHGISSTNGVESLKVGRNGRKDKGRGG